MIRIDKGGVKDVGPRSAHIAGMEYAVFMPEEEIVDPQLELFSPKPGDPKDYVCIRLKNGKRITITNTCAANVLGLVDPEYFSYGNAESARKAMQPIADYMNVSVEEVATQILTRAYEKISPVILELADKYKNLAEETDVLFLDASAFAGVSAKDSLHLDIEGHRLLSDAVCEVLYREAVIPRPEQADV